MAKLIKECKTVRVVSVARDAIRDEGVASLAYAMKESKTVTTLRLEGAGIGRDDVKALAEAIKREQGGDRDELHC